MRVCPKCGYIDSYIWQPARARRIVSVARFEDFVNEYPTIDFSKQNPIQIGEYAYKMTKSRKWVERQCVRDNPAWQSSWNLKYEHSSSSIKWQIYSERKPKSQTKLLEVTK